MLTYRSLPSAAEAFCAAVRGGVFTDVEGLPLEAEEGLERALGLLRATGARGGKVYLVGNGGSAAVASHAATDLMRGAGLRAATVHDAPLLTCLSNDHGYERAYALALGRHLRRGDLVVAISSSGRSPNILNAARVALATGASLLTLSGFRGDNPLRALGTLNYWLESDDYGVVELGHLFLLHHLTDRLALERGPATVREACHGAARA